MLEQATKKLGTEIEQNQNVPYVRHVGNFLLKHLHNNPDSAEKFMAEGKTIKGSLTEMRKEAQKHQVDNCGVLTDEEGFNVVLRYYGIDATAPAPASVEEKAPEARFDVKLDDLLK